MMNFVNLLQKSLLLIAFTSAINTLAQELDCSFQQDEDVLGDGSLLLRHAVNPTAQTVTMQLEYVGAAWISLAWTETGRMFPATAIIGLPAETDAALAVQKYDMTSYSSVLPSEASRQTLTETAIEQTGGITTLTFTKPLVEDGEIAVTAGSDAAPMMIMWAYGTANLLSAHLPTARGVYSVTLAECVAAAAAPEPVTAVAAPTKAPAAAASAASGAAPQAQPQQGQGQGQPQAQPATAPVAAANQGNGGGSGSGGGAAAGSGNNTSGGGSLFPTDEATVESNATEAVDEGEAAPLPEDETNSTSAGASTNAPGENIRNANETDTTSNETDTESNSTDTAGAATAGLDCSFQEDLDVLGTGEMLIRQSINPTAQTVTMQLEYVGLAWISLAWTETGRMFPATAIIGLSDETDTTLAVQKYDMTSYSSVVPAEAFRQTLSDTAIEQTDDGRTILTFTKPLVERSEIAVTATDTPMMIMWAYGMSNVLSAHLPTARGVFNVTFTQCVEVAAGTTAAPTVPATAAPTAAPTVPPPSASPTVYTTSSPTVPLSLNATLNCAPQSGLPFDIIEGELWLNEFIFNPLTKMITVEVEWIGEAYLSLGFSVDGKMVPRVAIIGLPDDQDVQKYQMTSYALETVVLSKEEHQTLINASITQVEGITKLRYTKPIADVDDETIVPGEPVRFIWAYGIDNALGMHANRGDAYFKLQTCLEDDATLPPTVTPVETTAPSVAPVAATALTTPAGDGGGVVDLGNGRIQRKVAVAKDNVEFTITTDEPKGTITVDMVYAGLGYVSFAVGTTLLMPMAISVMALPDLADVPEKYDLGPTKAMSDVTRSPDARQTLMNHTMFQNATHTGMSFTKLMVEGDEPLVNILGKTPFLYAMGGDYDFEIHTIAGSFEIDLASLDGAVTAGSSPNKTLWMIHGILLGLAWAVLVPLGVACSILRGLFTDTTGLWFRTHRNLNSLAVALTIVGFGMAVYLISDEQEGAKHFQTMKHHTTGLVVFLFALVQALSGIFRPPAPHKPAPKADTGDDAKSTYSEGFVDEEVEKGATMNGGGMDKIKEGPKATDHHDDDHDDHPKKSGARIAFEIQHRVVGLVCMILGWVTSGSGIDIYNKRFDEGTAFTGILWGVVAGLSVVTVILAVIQKSRQM